MVTSSLEHLHGSGGEPLGSGVVPFGFAYDNRRLGLTVCFVLYRIFEFLQGSPLINHMEERTAGYQEAKRSGNIPCQHAFVVFSCCICGWAKYGTE